jgi:RNA polymerase sigma-70 factor (ECF subfamily)
MLGIGVHVRGLGTRFGDWELPAVRRCLLNRSYNRTNVADTTCGLHFDGSVLPSWGEQRLVAALREGQDSAYEALIVLYQQPVYNLVARLMNEPSDASDVVQEVFLKVFRNINSFRSNSSLKTWMYRIAVNEAHNHRRWFSRHQRQEVTLNGGDETAPNYEERLTDPGRSPYELAAGMETRALVEEALAQLSPKFRTAVVLRDIEDLSYEEIAAILDISLGTVKSRIVRGRDAMRKLLETRLEKEAVLPLSPQPVE